MTRLRPIALCCFAVLLLLPAAGHAVPAVNPHLVSITIVPAAPRLAPGTKLRFTAFGHYSDTTVKELPGARFSSTNRFVATIAGDGVATGQAAGVTSITARLGRVIGSTTLTVTNAVLVSISIIPINPAVARKRTLQLTAVGTFSDGSSEDLTDQVKWSSDNPNIGRFTHHAGLVLGRQAGAAQIRARFGSVTGSTTLFVS